MGFNALVAWWIAIARSPLSSLNACLHLDQRRRSTARAGLWIAAVTSDRAEPVAGAAAGAMWRGASSWKPNVSCDWSALVRHLDVDDPPRGRPSSSGPPLADQQLISG